jgi:hypothetical protein
MVALSPKGGYSNREYLTIHLQKCNLEMKEEREPGDTIVDM